VPSRQGLSLLRCLKDLDGRPWETRIAEPQRRDLSRWPGNGDARRTAYNDPARLRLEVGQQVLRIGAVQEHSVERIAVLRADLPPCNLVDGERRHDVDALELRSSIRSRRRGGEGAGAGHVGRHSRRLGAVAAVLAGAPKALETGALGVGELGFVFPLCRLPATLSCSDDPSPLSTSGGKCRDHKRFSLAISPCSSVINQDRLPLAIATLD
jgi:hypothetical protein